MPTSRGFAFDIDDVEALLHSLYIVRNNLQGVPAMKLVASLSLLIAVRAGSLASAQEVSANRKLHSALIQKVVEAEADSLLALYKHLHAYPELAFQEEQTAARLAKELRKSGFEVTEKVGITG